MGRQRRLEAHLSLEVQRCYVERRYLEGVLPLLEVRLLEKQGSPEDSLRRPTCSLEIAEDGSKSFEPIEAWTLAPQHRDHRFPARITARKVSVGNSDEAVDLL